MSDPAIARTLLEGGDEASRTVPCAVCGKPAPLPNFIWESVKLWNRDEAKIAESEGRHAKFISTHELGMTCGPECLRAEYQRRRALAQRESETTIAYLAMLHAGKYNPESLAWLRARGLARHVERILAKEGTTKAHGG